MSTIDVTAKTFFERLYSVLGQSSYSALIRVCYQGGWNWVLERRTQADGKETERHRVLVPIMTGTAWMDTLGQRHRTYCTRLQSSTRSATARDSCLGHGPEQWFVCSPPIWSKDEVGYSPPTMKTSKTLVGRYYFIHRVWCYLVVKKTDC